MQIDEIYIKQCDCPEIQGRWVPKVGARIATRSNRVDTSFILLPSHMRSIGMTLAEEYIWLPRQEDWQNILFSQHYAPALPIESKQIRWAMINMHREFVDYMEAWKIEQPCEAWVRLYMNRAHNKTWTGEGWIDG